MKWFWNLNNKLLSVWFIFHPVWISAFWSQPADTVLITPWRYDKPGAVSVSFDDGDELQYSIAAPIMEQYGIRGTFSIVGEWTAEKPAYTAEEGMFKIRRMSWEQLKRLTDKRHEIAAHGYRHVPYPKFAPSDSIAVQMKKIKNLIEQKLQRPVYTLHYPYSIDTDSIRKAARKAGFLLARTAEAGKRFNTYDNFDPYYLASIPIYNDTIPSLEKFQQILDGARGKWLIWMYHHIFPPQAKENRIMKYHNVLHTYSVVPEIFARQMKSIARSGYWIAPEYEVGAYIITRKHAEIQVTGSKCKRIVKLIAHPPSNTPPVPLTLAFYTNWKKVKILQNNKKEIKRNEKGKILLEAYPGEEIIIKNISATCPF